jgi:DMSO/TMAO reductase YedYZ molybdopterin-dependent catalytic subunit
MGVSVVENEFKTLPASCYEDIPNAMLKRIRIDIFFLLLFTLLGGCGKNSETSDTAQTDAVSGATTGRYREGEIAEYDGIRLDPAVFARDNSISGVQRVDIANYQLEIFGLVEKPLQLKYEEVLALEPYERKITLHCVEGWDATVLWKGVRIIEIIDLAQATAEANTVIFYGVDGYTTSLPLQTVIERDMILAYNANGLDLPPDLGYPFIVVAEDKLGYKWARWVSGIELSDNQNYKGYWEQYGYDNEAEVQQR